MKNIAAVADLHLDKRRERKDGTYPVKLKITYNRERKYFNTTVNLAQADWLAVNSKRIPKAFAELHDNLQLIRISANNCIKELDTFSFLKFEEAYFPKRSDKKDVAGAYKEYIDNLRQKEQFGTADTYECSISALLKFKQNLKFEHITPIFLEKFEKSLLERGLSITTVGVYLRPLRAIFNKEIKDKNIPRDSYPFGKVGFIIPKGKSRKIALPINIIKEIVSFDASSKNLLGFYRDIWLFSFYCNGMNIADICNLKYENLDIHSFHFNRLKTIRTYM